MVVEALDHVNIRTGDVVATSRFLAEVLDMEVRDTPGFPDRAMAAWICDGEGRAIIHLGTGDVRYPWEQTSAVAPRGSGRIHHVALRCSGYDDVVARLDRQGRAYNANSVPEVGLRQLFIEEPNGITLELNFFGD